MTLASGRFRGARIWQRQFVTPHIFIAGSSFAAKLKNNARRRWLSKKSNQMGRRKKPTFIWAVELELSGTTYFKIAICNCLAIRSVLHISFRNLVNNIRIE
jgi:hypothetical protein